MYSYVDTGLPYVIGGQHYVRIMKPVAYMLLVLRCPPLALDINPINYYKAETP